MSATDRDAAAARGGDDDLREGRPGAPRVRCPRARRPRGRGAAARRAAPHASPPRLPEVSEPELVRHYVNLSKRNFDLDSGFYPLGSCTMKHNPRLHERVAALRGPRAAAPAAGPRARPGRARADVEPRARAGRDRRAAARLAAAQRRARTASWPGVLLTKAFHADRGEERTKVLTPDTAHGTNPATVTMAGYEVVKVGTNADGGVDVDDLRAKADDERRLPDAHQPQHAGDLRRQHRGDRRTSSTTWGRRSTTTAPTSTRSWASRARATWASTSCTSTCTSPSPSPTAAAAPARARSRSPTASSPTCRARSSRARDDGRFDLDDDRPKSIGKLRGFQGNYGCFVRSYAYIRSLGAEGLKDASRDRGAQRQLPARAPAQPRRGRPAAAGLRRAVHARVRALGGADEARAADPHARPGQAPARPRLPPADGLLPAAGRRGAARRADRDRDARDARRLRRGAWRRSCARRAEDPTIARDAPYTTPVRRLDEAAAAKRPVIRQPL